MVENEPIDAEFEDVKSGNTSLQVGQTRALATAADLDWTPETLAKQIEKETAMRNIIVTYTKEAMQPDHHYYVISGSTRPAISKEGALNLCSLFKVTLAPPIVEKVYHPGSDHLTVTTRVNLVDRNGNIVATGDGLATTYESKWRYRNADRECPECKGKGTVKKSKFPPKHDPDEPPGFYCYDKAGGCGANFAFDDKRITEQVLGKIENENLADLWNTVIKMSDKRASVAAATKLPLVSELFTQDVDESHIADAVGIDRQAAQSTQQNRQTSPANTSTQKAPPRQRNNAKTKDAPPPATAPAVEPQPQFDIEADAKLPWEQRNLQKEIMAKFPDSLVRVVELMRDLNAAGDSTKWGPITLADYVNPMFEVADSVRSFDNQGQWDTLISDLELRLDNLR